MDLDDPEAIEAASLTKQSFDAAADDGSGVDMPEDAYAMGGANPAPPPEDDEETAKKRRKAEDEHNEALRQQANEPPLKRSTGWGKFHSRWLLDTKDHGNFLTAAGQGQKGRNGRQLSEKQMRNMIYKMVAEKGMTELFMYKGNKIDPEMTRVARSILADMQAPGGALHGYQAYFSDTRMKNVEPWRGWWGRMHKASENRHDDKLANKALKKRKKETKKLGKRYKDEEQPEERDEDKDKKKDPAVNDAFLAAATAAAVQDAGPDVEDPDNGPVTDPEISAGDDVVTGDGERTDAGDVTETEDEKVTPPATTFGGNNM